MPTHVVLVGRRNGIDELISAHVELARLLILDRVACKPCFSLYRRLDMLLGPYQTLFHRLLDGGSFRHVEQRLLGGRSFRRGG